REFDEKALKLLPPGSFYTEPPGVDHFAMTRATGVVISITGTGPSGTTYVDPKNHPTRKECGPSGPPGRPQGLHYEENLRRKPGDDGVELDEVVDVVAGH